MDTAEVVEQNVKPIIQKFWKGVQEGPDGKRLALLNKLPDHLKNLYHKNW